MQTVLTILSTIAIMANTLSSEAKPVEMTYITSPDTETVSSGITPTSFSKIVSFDRTVFDFGDILLSDGPVKCSFTAKNISSKPIVIYNVVSSCGCTEVKWTREPILPGKTGRISATYSNDEGAYPFDKTLTVYISDIKKPIILRLRGVSHSKKLSLNQMYGTAFGDLAFKDADIKCGNLEQGQQKSGEVTIANLGSNPAKISFDDVTPGLKLIVSPNPIPSRSTAKMTYTITASKDKWGRNYYYATPLVDGKSYKATVTDSAEEEADSERGAMNATDLNPLLGEGKSQIGIWAFTKENFGDLSQDEIDNGSEPLFSASTCSFGKMKRGKTIDAVFKGSNQGKNTFVVHKVDSDSPNTYNYYFPNVKPGANAHCKVRFSTANLPKGETLVILTLTTNSPLRPVINLYITGWII